MSLPDYIFPGAFVTLRDGRKARIYATDGIPQYPIHGAIQDSGWSIQLWTEAGHFYTGEPEHDRTIVGPWIDKPDCSKLWPLLPPWIEWVAMDDGGNWFGYSQKPTRGDEVCIGGPITEIPAQYAPTFSGDWKDSLCERPKS